MYGVEGLYPVCVEFAIALSISAGGEDEIMRYINY